MSWMMLAPTILGGLMGANSASRKAEQQQRGNLAQAEVTRYSPWTGMKGQLDNSYTPSGMEGGFSGAVQGLGIGQSLNQAFGANPQQNMLQDDGEMYGNQAGYRNVMNSTPKRLF